MVKSGKEWLYRTPKPTFWRATTDNDRGNGFPFRSGMWLAADMFQKCVDVQVQIDGIRIEKPIAPVNNKYSDKETAERVEIVFTYETLTVPSTQVKVSYLVFSDGNVRVRAHYYGKEGLPELPAFGIRFIIPTEADGFVYEGLSGETYPDRKAGGVHGIYEVEGLPVTPYLVPQECGMHVDTEWVKVKRSKVLDNRKRHMEQSELTFRAGNEISHSKLHSPAFRILQKNLKMQRIRKSCRRQGERYYAFMVQSGVSEESTAGDRMWKRSTGFRETGYRSRIYNVDIGA